MTKTLVLARVFPPAIGGSGQWMWDVYTRLPRGEYVVSAGIVAGCEDFDRTHALPIHRLPLELKSWGAVGWQSGADYLSIYRQLRTIVRCENASQVHAACVLPEGFLAWLLSRRNGVPYLLYVHGEELNVVRKSRELKWLARRVFGGAAVIVANSRNTKRLLAHDWNANPNRIRVTHPGVDTNEYFPVPRDLPTRRRLGWGERPVILCVGRLQRRKGQDLLIRCLPRVREKIPEVLCAIVGNGEDAELLRQIVKQDGLKENVTFHGQLAGDELRRAYQQCDVFALPNREVDGDIEGFGIVLLEAQACGKPVVTGNSGGTSEAMDPNVTGRLVDANNLSALSDTLCELLANPQQISLMGIAAREHVLKHFTIESMVQRLSAAYRDMIPPILAEARTQ